MEDAEAHDELSESKWVVVLPKLLDACADVGVVTHRSSLSQVG